MKLADEFRCRCTCAGIGPYALTNCLTFMHFIPTTTFESNQYNLGHYLEDNSKDFYASAEWKPLRALLVRLYYNRSLKGPDHTALGTPGRASHPPFDPVVWESQRAGLLSTFEVINGLYLRLGYEWRRVEGEQDYLDRWTAEVYHGTTGTFRFGLNYGF